MRAGVAGALRNSCRNILHVTFSNRNVSLQVMQKDTKLVFLSAHTLEPCFQEHTRVRSDKRAARVAALVLGERAAQAGVTLVAPATSYRYHGKYKEVVDALTESGVKVLAPFAR
jgi:ribosomal protein L18